MVSKNLNEKVKIYIKLNIKVLTYLINWVGVGMWTVNCEQMSTPNGI